MRISIFRTPWGQSCDGRSIEFYDDDINGCRLSILYFADAGLYRIALFQDELECAFEYDPAAGEYGQVYPDPDTLQQMVNAAFGAQGEELFEKPLAYFEQVVQGRFEMDINELYAMPEGQRHFARNRAIHIDIVSNKQRVNYHKKCLLPWSGRIPRPRPFRCIGFCGFNKTRRPASSFQEFPSRRNGRADKIMEQSKSDAPLTHICDEKREEPARTIPCRFLLFTL